MSAELRPGAELGPSVWLEITQARIDAFAEATDDRQAIHVDPDFAAAGPFGETVAHGLLTLSLIVPMWAEVAGPHEGTTLNYGLNRVRFPAPVPSGSRIRARFRVESVEPVAGGTQAAIAATVEREGHDKPVCVAELLLRFLG
ncbi:MAG TPA: MaoC family dehydratase [Gaiellaceae bacterium]|nr:MaoC family dehydratase [Gaiellaceae bacterium]